MNDTITLSDNISYFRNNLLERIQILLISTDIKARDWKLQCHVNRNDAKILASSTEKLDKYECLTDEDILRFNQNQVIEQAKFIYSLFGTAVEKLTKKQADALKSWSLSNKIGKLNQIESIFPQNHINNLIFNRLK